MKVFLTGGTGLVGSHVAVHLRAAGHEVVALQRESSDVAHLGSLGCTVIPGDINDAATTLGKAMRGCDAVVHSAALVYSSEGWPAVHRTNVDGAGNVARAARLADVPTLAHISSVAVYGDRPGPIDEETPLDQPLPERDSYARSKRLAEGATREALGEGGTGLVIIRPSAVYGERDRLFAPKLVRMVRRPLIFLLGPGEAPLPVIYAGNLAHAIVRAVEVEARGTFVVAEDHPVPQRDFLAGLASALGHTPRFLQLPSRLVRGVADVVDGLGIRIPGARDLPVSRVVRFCLCGNPYESERVRKTLDWTPPHSLEEGLRRTAADYTATY